MIHKLGLKVAELSMTVDNFKRISLFLQAVKSSPMFTQNGDGGSLSFNDAAYGELNFLRLRLFLCVCHDKW